MAAAADQSLLQPLIPKATEGDNGTTATSDSGILLRLLSVILIGAVSLWANHEASKGFDIIIINNAKDSLLGRKFELFYQSDDTAARILLNASSFAERFLYDGVTHRHRKPVNRVIIRFSGNNSMVAQRIPVTSGASHGEYIISLSSSLMEHRDYDHIIKRTLRRAVVKIWLCGEEETGAPPQLVDGMAEHIAAAAAGEEISSEPLDGVRRGGGGGCWKDKDAEAEAESVAKATAEAGDDRTVDMALGKRSEDACDSYREMLRRLRHRHIMMRDRQM